MSTTYTYRPKMFKVEELVDLAKKKHTNLNRYIEDALREKIAREKGGKAQVLADKITRVVVEHMGLKLTKPDAKTAAKIDLAVEQAKKPGHFVSDKDLRPHAHKAI